MLIYAVKRILLALLILFVVMLAMYACRAILQPWRWGRGRRRN